MTRIERKLQESREFLEPFSYGADVHLLFKYPSWMNNCWDIFVYAATPELFRLDERQYENIILFDEI